MGKKSEGGIFVQTPNYRTDLDWIQANYDKHMEYAKNLQQTAEMNGCEPPVKKKGNWFSRILGCSGSGNNL